MQPQQPTTQTNIEQFIAELDSGRLATQLAKALSLCAAAAFDNDSPAKLSLTLNIKKIAGSSQVQVASKLDYKHPTTIGSKAETFIANTPMHIGSGGKMTYLPETQLKLFTADTTKA